MKHVYGSALFEHTVAISDVDFYAINICQNGMNLVMGKSTFQSYIREFEWVIGGPGQGENYRNSAYGPG